MDGLLCFLCVFFQYLIHYAGGESEHCFDSTSYLFRETGLGAKKFWSSKAQDVEQCMKLCVRQKQCKSINYDLKTGMCTLNKNFRKSKQKYSNSNLYSEFQLWPPEVDKNCYYRPCNENEVCIPKTLTMSTDDGGCPYSCMQFSRPVCPLPKKGTTNGRDVGSVNTVQCPKGTTGGGSATCLPELKWDKKIPDCVGFRFQNVNSSVRYVRGFLETNYDGEWKTVNRRKWTWRNTQVACRDILGLQYGGSTRILKVSQSNEIAVDMHCNGNEKTLGECDFRGTSNKKSQRMILYCFKSNITSVSFENITLSTRLPSLNVQQPQKDANDFLWVKFENIWRPVGKECSKNGHTWGKNETSIACRTMFPNETNKNQVHTFRTTKTNSDGLMIFICEGDESHLFHCSNRICLWSKKQVELKCN